MLHLDMKALARARERVREPLLTALTIIMATLMFIIVPIHAAGLLQTQTIGFGVCSYSSPAWSSFPAASRPRWQWASPWR